MKSPLSLIAVAVLFILVGAEAAWQWFAEAFRGQLLMNPFLLCLLVGTGLLFRLQLWRYIALIFVWSLIITLVVCSALVYAFPAGSQGYLASWRTMPVQVTIGRKWGLLFMLLLLGWMHWVLVRRDVCDLFKNRAIPSSALVKSISRLLLSLPMAMLAMFAFFFVISRPLPPSSLSIAVARLGYTNGPTGARLAVFTVTNQEQNPIERGPMYSIEVRGDPGRSTSTPPLPHLPSAVVLQPGQSESVSIPVPAITGEWRVTLWCTYYGSRQKLRDWLRSSRGAIVPNPWRSVSTSFQGVRSEWIAE
jgi:hypothetical protein